jgi:hypothetical protein
MQTYSQRKYMIELRRRYIRKVSYTLPSEYKQVEYIESSGGQYFRITLITEHDLEFKVKFNKIGDYFYLGSSVRSKEFYIWGKNWDNPFRNATTSPPSENLIYKIKTISNVATLYIEDNVICNVSYNTIGCTYCVNGMNRSNSIDNLGYNRYYYIEFFKQGTNITISKLIPCYREADGKVGMYDVINRVFYTSESGIDFLAGPLQGT